MLCRRIATCLFFSALCWGAAASAQIAIIKDKTVPLFELPSLQSKLLGVLSAGDTVRILQTRSGWVQLTTRKPLKGWMRTGAKASSHFLPLAKKSRAEITGNAPYDGGLVFGLGTLGGDFAYIGRFYYRNLPRWELEGSFEYVAGQIASIYLMHVNTRHVRPLKNRFDGYATLGVGVINTVPIQSAGGKTISNMALNYGLGVQRRLNHSNRLRADVRQFTAIRQQGTLNFLEFTVGLALGVNWGRL